MRTEPRRLTPSEQRLAAALDPSVADRLVMLRDHVARLALLPDVPTYVVDAIGAEVRKLRAEMDDALAAGRSPEPRCSELENVRPPPIN